MLVKTSESHKSAAHWGLTNVLRILCQPRTDIFSRNELGQPPPPPPPLPQTTRFRFSQILLIMDGPSLKKSPCFATSLCFWKHQIPGLDEKPLPSDSLLRAVLERRADGLCPSGYHLVITSRPCNTVYDLLRQPGSNRLTYHLTGFSRKTRDMFMRGYVKRRHHEDWDAIQRRMDRLLSRASSFTEPLTRLPLVATFLAELLPVMDLKEVPKSRWELFNTLLLRGLLRRDLPGMVAEVVTSDFCQLPSECQQALLLLCDLALDGLLAEQPKLVFKYADIVAKCKGQPKTVKDNLLEVAKSVMVSFCEADETQEEVTYFHFLHLSFQEFFAAMALKYPTGEHTEKNGTLRLASCARTLMIGERFDNFWLFAAGFFKTDPEVFFRTLFSNISIDMTTISVQQLSMQSMLFKMLQEMIPEVSDYHAEKYSSALELISVFLNRKVSDVRTLYKLGRYSAYIPVENITDSAALCHALRLLPNLITLEVQSLTGFGDVLAALQGPAQAWDSSHWLSRRLLEWRFSRWGSEIGRISFAHKASGDA